MKNAMVFCLLWCRKINGHSSPFLYSCLKSNTWTVTFGHYFHFSLPSEFLQLFSHLPSSLESFFSVLVAFFLFHVVTFSFVSCIQWTRPMDFPWTFTHPVLHSWNPTVRPSFSLYASPSPFIKNVFIFVTTFTFVILIFQFLRCLCFWLHSEGSRKGRGWIVVIDIFSDVFLCS